MKFFLFIFFIIISLCANSEELEKILMKNKCYYCHQQSGIIPQFPKERPEKFNLTHQCIDCHVNNVFAVGEKRNIWWTHGHHREITQRIGYFHPFLSIPKLSFSEIINKKEIIRYSECGLNQYLSNPLPRLFFSKESMFPLRSKKLKEMKEVAAKYAAKCGDLQLVKNKDLFSKGKQLFKKNDCLSCHSYAGKNLSHDSKFIRLRQGIPLLSFEFFKMRMQNGTQNEKSPQTRYQFKWYKSADGKTFERGELKKLAMPAYEMSEEDLKAIYHYIAFDRTDIKQDPKMESYPPIHFNKEEEIYPFVMSQVFDQNCKHCHVGNEDVLKTSQDVFGLGHLDKMLKLPAVGSHDVDFKMIADSFSPNESCGHSKLVERMYLRHKEWNGKIKTETKMRGMPLGQAPYDLKVIEAVHNWTKLGCPRSDGKKLCKPCD